MSGKNNFTSKIFCTYGLLVLNNNSKTVFEWNKTKAIVTIDIITGVN
jgi:hypothetical protein